MKVKLPKFKRRKEIVPEKKLRAKRTKKEKAEPLTDTKKTLTCEDCGEELKRRDYHEHQFALPGVHKMLCTGMLKHDIQQYAKLSKRRMVKIESHVTALARRGLSGEALNLARLALVWS